MCLIYMLYNSYNLTLAKEAESMTTRTQKRRNTRKRNKMLNSLFHVLLAVSGSIVFLVWAFEFGATL